jgi:GTPase SAR1 family protein
MSSPETFTALTSESFPLLNPQQEQTITAPTTMTRDLPNGTTAASSSVVAATDSLKALQSKQQQQILDTVDELRKCGLDTVLSLPQLVVCGDQSAGKSSVLEALTEIPFPRKDNLCTRFATEIILRRAHDEVATVKIVPDEARGPVEKAGIKKFGATLTNFDDLPDLIERATEVMGIGEGGKTFSDDLLSIEIAGPNRPQLTVVDLPGLIQNGDPEDIKLVRELTQRYISSPRTICLAVISATHDHANQGILQMIRKYDKEGNRTLGIITKPDRLEKDSGSEQSYLKLARNEEAHLKLGWHVLKNRSHADKDINFLQRNANEAMFFHSTNWKTIPRENVGIIELSKRLSQLLFVHVKHELPKLRDDLEHALEQVHNDLDAMGADRSNAKACKAFLLRSSDQFSNTCKAAAGGYYDGVHFQIPDAEEFDPATLPSLRRLRAAVQELNSDFSHDMRKNGSKIRIKAHPSGSKGIGFAGFNSDSDVEDHKDADDNEGESDMDDHTMTYEEALDWVKQAVRRNRGKELQGNFNPLLIGELFQTQSSKWTTLAKDHINLLDEVCSIFLEDLLGKFCPDDVTSRLWPRIEEQLRDRKKAAFKVLGDISKDLEYHPINYNHYYTDTVQKRRNQRQMKSAEAMMQNMAKLSECGYQTPDAIDYTLEANANTITQDMERHSCEEVLDCVQAIYKVRMNPITTILPN